MDKELWLIWKEPKTRRRYKVGTLVFEDGIYTFKYVNPELEEARADGFDYFPGFEDINKIYTSKELFANINTRLFNPKREDYLELLNAYNLEIDSSKIEILKATKGRLITDNYEFVPAFDKRKIEFDLAGTRYCKDIEKCKDIIKENDVLYLELEPQNIYDKNTIKVMYNTEGNKYHLGYVPRYYSKDLYDILKTNVSYSAMVQRCNFESQIKDEDITVRVKLIFR